MKTFVCLLAFVLMWPAFLFSQELSTQQDSMNYLFKELKRSKIEILKLKHNQWYADSLAYEGAYRVVAEAIEQGRALQESFILTSERLVADRALLRSASGQNISVGNFEKIMIESAEKMFDKNDRDTAKINTWKGIVGKLVRSPFVKGVLQSNPVGAAISSVVSAAHTFISNKLNQVTKGATVEMKEAFVEGQITGFKQRMDSYIAYYAQLEEVNQGFRYALDEIERRYEPRNAAISTYNMNLSRYLGSEQNTFDRRPDLDRMFRRKDMPNPELLFTLDGVDTPQGIENINFYKDVLEDPNVKKLIHHASLWKEYRRETDQFVEDFRATIVKFFREYRILFDGGQYTKARELLDEAKLREIMSDFDKAIQKHTIEKERELRLR